MFVYVAEFKGRPGLVKIGVAENVKARMAVLERSHGAVVTVVEFTLQDSSYTVERFVHKIYEGSRVLLNHRCDGYTEFFSESVKDQVCGILAGLSAPLGSRLAQCRLVVDSENIKRKQAEVHESKRMARANSSLNLVDLRNSYREHLADIIGDCAVFLPREWKKRCGVTNNISLSRGVFRGLLEEVNYSNSANRLSYRGMPSLCHPKAWSLEQIKNAYNMKVAQV